MVTKSASLANQQGVLFSAEAQTRHRSSFNWPIAVIFPLLFVQNVTGYMVGKEYEQRGIIKTWCSHDQLCFQQRLFRTLPCRSAGLTEQETMACADELTILRFLFIWPNSKTAVMGPQQLAGVMSLVQRAKAEATWQTV